MLDQTTHIIFATNFSDACHSAIPAVARWVDQLRCKLTILHVYNPEQVLIRDAERLLNSFFAEANNYPSSERVLIAGDVAEGIASFCSRQQNALLLLPPSDQAGLPRPWHRSLRAQLIGRLPMPVWTLGKTVVGQPLPANTSHVAALVQNPEEGTSHLRQAARYAARTRSTLHLFHIVPSIDEGSLTHTLHTAAPLGVDRATAWMNELTECLEPVEKFELHVEQGSLKKLLPSLLHRTGAEMLMVSSEGALQRNWLRPGVSPIFRKLNAGILVVPPTATAGSMHPARLADVLVRAS